MDLQLFIRVFWRFRTLVVAGFACALLFAFLASTEVSVGGGGIKTTPRGSETWEAKSVILITQAGFPYGRAVPRFTSPDEATQEPPVQLGDQTRFSALSQIYTGLANSDPVRARLLREVPVSGTVRAEASPDPVSGQPLPLLIMIASAGSAADAARLATGATGVFRDYVRQEQESADIPAAERIQLEVLESGAAPVLVAPRKKTLPMLVFVAVMLATAALVFVLENLRPRWPGAPGGELSEREFDFAGELAAVPVAEPERTRERQTA